MYHKYPQRAKYFPCLAGIKKYIFVPLIYFLLNKFNKIRINSDYKKH